MHLATLELRQLLESAAAVLVVGAQHGERHKNLVGVQTRIAATQIVGLGVLNRLDDMLGNELHGVVDAGELLDGVEYQCRARA